MKKLFVSLFSVLVGTLVLSGCSLSGDKAIIKSEKDIFNYTVLSAANLLSESASEAVTEEPTSTETGEPTTDVPKIETPAEEVVDSILDKYLSLIETYLNNQVITSTEVASDKEAFETVLTYQTKNMFGEVVSYKVYYNIVLTTEDADDDDLEDEQDMEVEYELTGIIVIDELTGDQTYEYVLIEKGNMQDNRSQNNHKHHHNNHNHQNNNNNSHEHNNNKHDDINHDHNHQNNFNNHQENNNKK